MARSCGAVAGGWVAGGPASPPFRNLACASASVTLPLQTAVCIWPSSLSLTLRFGLQFRPEVLEVVPAADLQRDQVVDHVVALRGAAMPYSAYAACFTSVETFRTVFV